MLCAAIIDGAIICGILMVINQDESPDFWPAVGCALIAAILGTAANYGLSLATGMPLAGAFAALVVSSIAVAASFMIVFSAELKRALLGGAIYFGIKIVLIFVWAFAFASVEGA